MTSIAPVEHLRKKYPLEQVVCSANFVIHYLNRRAFFHCASFDISISTSMVWSIAIFHLMHSNFQENSKFLSLSSFFLIQPHCATCNTSKIVQFLLEDSSPPRFRKILSANYLYFITMFFCVAFLVFRFSVPCSDRNYGYNGCVIKYWICSVEIVSSLVLRHRFHTSSSSVIQPWMFIAF